MTDELVHHLRQAEADLGLARASVGLALTRAANGICPRLRLIAGTMELMQADLQGLRQRAEVPGERQTLRDPPPGSSER